MNIARNTRRIINAALCAAIALVLVAHPAVALDKVRLHDGTLLEGEIVKEMEGYVWIKRTVGGIETTDFVSPEDIAEIMRDTKPATTDVKASKSPAKESKPRTRSGAPRAAVLTLGGGGDKDMVGIYMTADSIRDAIPTLEKELGDDGTGIVVLKINSGGGALLEIQKLSDVIHEELKPKFRVVAWIQSAISAAAMTSHCIEEIYFMPEGNYGACTGWYGSLQAVDGRDLEDVLFMMEKISARGGYHPAIMRSMQINSGLSATKRDDGTWEFFEGEVGEVIVCREEDILTFNSQTAERFGFSKGTARTLEELQQAMQLPEVEWVGEWKDGFIYPISKAEAGMMKFRDRTYDDQQRTQEYFSKYNLALNAAAGSGTRDERGKFVGIARRHLKDIVRMVKNNPNLALFVLNMPPDNFPRWVDQEEERLRDLMRN